MNRSSYFDYIEEKLNLLATRIISRARLNILNLNLHSESFYAGFVNELFGWNLVNANEINQNAEAIDLVDDQNRVIVQVSSTATKDKIERSLEKPLIAEKIGYRFKFISIARDADSLRSKSFKNPHGCIFDSQNDIIDKNSILSKILNSSIDEQKKIYDLIHKELGKPDEKLQLESSIAELINLLSKDDFQNIDTNPNVDPFEIDKKIDFNTLESVKNVIQEYSMYSPKVESKYEAFDKEGVNKSLSVLRAISKIYISEKAKAGAATPDIIFLNTVDQIAKLAKNSINFAPITLELLQMTAEIVTVDAFLRCKIFENPKVDNYAFT